MLLYLDKAATALGKAAEPSFDNTGKDKFFSHMKDKIPPPLPKPRCFV
jgi:hypothetical protein